MNKDERKRLKPGVRVVAIRDYHGSSYLIETGSPGFPVRTEYQNVKAGWTGTFVRSSSGSGPTFKIVKWDQTGIESEVDHYSIEHLGA